MLRVVLLLALGGCLARVHEVGYPELVELQKTGGPLPVLFHTKYCDMCKSFKPKFIKAANSLDGLIDAYVIECNKDTATSKYCTKWGLTKYPGLKILTSHEFYAPQFTALLNVNDPREFILQHAALGFATESSPEELVREIWIAQSRQLPHLFFVPAGPADFPVFTQVYHALKGQDVSMHVYTRLMKPRYLKHTALYDSFKRSKAGMFVYTSGSAVDYFPIAPKAQAESVLAWLAARSSP